MIRIKFKKELSTSDISEIIWPETQSIAIETSQESSPIQRHDVNTVANGSYFFVELKMEESNISGETINNIINLIPSQHIRTVYQ